MADAIALNLGICDSTGQWVRWGDPECVGRQDRNIESWDGSAGSGVGPGARRGGPRWLAMRRLSTRRVGPVTSTPDHVKSEFLFGAPEDVDLGPTSEDGYVAVMAYMALAEVETRPVARSRWLELARRAADWMLTFRYSYNVAFAPTTLLGRYDYRSRGADQASPANQHLHGYGLICLPEMVRLPAIPGTPTISSEPAENLRLLPPVHRPGGWGLQRKARDGARALLPDELRRREGQHRTTLACVVSGPAVGGVRRRRGPSGAGRAHE